MEFSFNNVIVIGNIVKVRDLISRESGETIGKGFTLATIGGSGKGLHLYAVAFDGAAAAVKAGARVKVVGSLQYGGMLKLVAKSITPVNGVHNGTLVQVSATATSIKRFVVANTARAGVCFSAQLANNAFLRAVSYSNTFSEVAEGGEYGLRGRLTLGHDTKGKPRIELLLSAVTTVDEIKARIAAKAAATAPTAEPAPAKKKTATSKKKAAAKTKKAEAVQQITAEEVTAAINAAKAEAAAIPQA